MMSAMKFSHQMTYDASPDAVAAMLADPAFREQVCEAMHASRHVVSVEGTGTGMRVVVDQTQPARGMPAFAKKVVGEEIQIVQRETWTGALTATLALETPGKPGGFAGTLALAADGDRTVETVVGEAKVKVPLIGAKLEGLVVDLLTTALRTEERVGRTWLAGVR